MRFVRILFTGVVVLSGLIVAAFFMVVGLVIFALLRLFGRPAKMPVFRSAPSFQRTPPRRPLAHHDSDVIDVETTPVK